MEGLAPFLLHDVRPTGENIGRGAYGSVEKVRIPGAVCAAKKIHSLYQDRSEIPAEDIQRAADSFVSECQLMTTLRHPHIVQFLGVCFWPDSPLPCLVMELLCTDLHSLLEGGHGSLPRQRGKDKPFFPLGLKVSVLHDVASGLCYLHERSPPVIHRDLSARNVLLTSGMVAKIADLGVARIVSFVRGQANFTKGPGAPVYMPPEAVAPSSGTPELSCYDGTIDIFSFGVVSIFTLSQTFPNDLKTPNYGWEGVLKARTELERREHYVATIYDSLGKGHPLIRLIEGCLQNTQCLRPDIQQVLQLLDEARDMVRDDEESGMNKLELIRVVHDQKENQMRQGDLREELQTKELALEQLEEARQEAVAQLQCKQLEAKAMYEQVESMRLQEAENLRSRDEEIAIMRQEKERIIEELQQTRDANDMKMSYLEGRLTSSEGLVAEFQSTLLQKNKELEELARILDSKKCQPTPKPRKRLPSKPQSPQPQQGCSSPTTTCDDEASGSTDSESKLRVTLKATSQRFGMTRGSASSDKNFAYFTGLGSTTVFCYSLERETWSQLAQCPYRNFALTTVDGALITVGGRKGHSQYTNKLFTLRLGVWFEELPPMRVARESPAVVTLHDSGRERDIVVAGGSVSDSKWTASVEVLDVSTKSWSSLIDLPQQLPFPSAALRHTPTGGTLLLSVIGCYRDGYNCLLYLSMESVRASGWSSLPQLTASGSTAAVLQDQLVVVGGSRVSGSICVMHQLIEDRWVELRRVSCGRECLIASTLDDRLVIVGGDSGSGKVWVCSLTQ